MARRDRTMTVIGVIVVLILLAGLGVLIWHLATPHAEPTPTPPVVQLPTNLGNLNNLGGSHFLTKGDDGGGGGGDGGGRCSAVSPDLPCYRKLDGRPCANGFGQCRACACVAKNGFGECPPELFQGAVSATGTIFTSLSPDDKAILLQAAGAMSHRFAALNPFHFPDLNRSITALGAAIIGATAGPVQVYSGASQVLGKAPTGALFVPASIGALAGALIGGFRSKCPTLHDLGRAPLGKWKVADIVTSSTFQLSPYGLPDNPAYAEYLNLANAEASANRTNSPRLTERGIDTNDSPNPGGEFCDYGACLYTLSWRADAGYFFANICDNHNKLENAKLFLQEVVCRALIKDNQLDDVLEVVGIGCAINKPTYAPGTPGDGADIHCTYRWRGTGFPFMNNVGAKPFRP